MAALVAAAGLSLSFLVMGCSKKSAQDYVSAGDQALHDNQIPAAEKDYQDAVKLAPNDPKVHLALGKFYMATENPGPAQTEFLKAINLDPSDPVAHAQLAKLYSDQAQINHAEEQWRAAASLEPGNSAYRAGLAATLERNSKWTEAERELRTAVGLSPDDANLRVALGALYAAQGRNAEAQAEYTQAKAIDPNVSLPLSSAGLVGSTPPASVNSKSPLPAPSEAAAPAASGPVPAAPSVKVVDKKFLLSHNSPVYQTPNVSGTAVATVHRGRWVHVIGVAGNWLQIKMRSGTVGFIPVSAAE